MCWGRRLGCLRSRREPEPQSVGAFGVPQMWWQVPRSESVVGTSVRQGAARDGLFRLRPCLLAHNLNAQVEREGWWPNPRAGLEPAASVAC